MGDMMGLTIKGVNQEFNCGYGHFFILRKMVAEAVSKKLKKAYEELCTSYLTDIGLECQKDEQEMRSKEYQKICEKLKLPHCIHDFLWAEDSQGTLSWMTAEVMLPYLRKLPKVRKDILISYARENATVRTFIKMLKDAVKTKTDITWE